MTHDYQRNGTTDLFASMNVTTGEVLTHCHQGHTAKDVLRFFKQIDATVPRGLAVHVVLDNLSTHQAPEITKWLAHMDRRRWHLHFTPTSSSWTNLIERWLEELTDRRLRRGVFTSVSDLEDAIALWATHWNDDPKPFVWKATAERRHRQSPTRPSLPHPPNQYEDGPLGPVSVSPAEGRARSVGSVADRGGGRVVRVGHRGCCCGFHEGRRAAPRGSFQVPAVGVQPELNSLRKLWQARWKPYSWSALVFPRSRSRSPVWATSTCPKTGSTIAFRRA